MNIHLSLFKECMRGQIQLKGDVYYLSKPIYDSPQLTTDQYDQIIRTVTKYMTPELRALVTPEDIAGGIQLYLLEYFERHKKIPCYTIHGYFNLVYRRYFKRNQRDTEIYRRQKLNLIGYGLSIDQSIEDEDKKDLTPIDDSFEKIDLQIDLNHLTSKIDESSPIRLLKKINHHYERENAIQCLNLTNKCKNFLLLA